MSEVSAVHGYVWVCRCELTLILLKCHQFVDGIYAMSAFLHCFLLERFRQCRSICDLKENWVVQHDGCIRSQCNYGLIHVGAEKNYNLRGIAYF